MSTTNLRYEDGVWKAGCGCGGKPKTKVTIPENSVALQVFKNGQITGPVSGLKYNLMPGDIAIDIDQADADFWLAEGTAKAWNGQNSSRGRLARIK